MHRVTLFASNFAPDLLTVDFQYGGPFSLPGGLYVDGGRDGLAGESVLRFLGGNDDDVVQVADAQAGINHVLVVSWTANLGTVIFETGAGDDLLIVSGMPLAGGLIDLVGGANTISRHRTEEALLRIATGGTNSLDFRNAAPRVDRFALDSGQLQQIVRR